MLERIKRALLESYVGAIALGYLIGYGFIHLANVFTDPVTQWVVQIIFPAMRLNSGSGMDVYLKSALQQLLAAAFPLLLGYVLLRWLYFRPKGSPAASTEMEKEQPELEP
jgi:hypothetical protein